jgi:hypothetical protein
MCTIPRSLLAQQARHPGLAALDLLVSRLYKQRLTEGGGLTQ